MFYKDLRLPHVGVIVTETAHETEECGHVSVGILFFGQLGTERRSFIRQHPEDVQMVIPAQLYYAISQNN